MNRTDMQLSICIPAYNRGATLPQLFDSIISELAATGDPGRVEVVVSDNASADDTPAVVERYREHLPNLSYVRQAENIGADRNYLAVVEPARGRFCWLMGSDDKVEKGALARVLRATEQWSDAAGFCVNLAGYDSTFSRRIIMREAFTLDGDRLFEGADAIFQEFGPYFGYLSGQVIRRDLWNAVVATGEQLNFLNAYVHVFVIGRMIQKCPRWGYLHQRTVGWRSGNDSFIADGWYKRTAIDVIGYHDISTALFGPGSKTANVMRDRIAAVHAFTCLWTGKSQGQPAAALRKGARLLTRYYWRSPVYYYKLLPWILVPRPLARAAYLSYMKGLRPWVNAIRMRRNRKRAAW